MAGIDYSISGLGRFPQQTSTGYGNSALTGLYGSAASESAIYSTVRNQILNDLEKERLAADPTYVNPSLTGNKKASDIMGKLTRAQWQDYKDRFQPIEAALMNKTIYNNPDLIPQGIAQGAQTVNAAYDTAAISRQRMMERYGVNQRADEQAAYNRRAGLERSSAIVDSANRIRQRLEDRTREIAIGSTPNAGRAYGLSSSGGDY